METETPTTSGIKDSEEDNGGAAPVCEPGENDEVRGENDEDGDRATDEDD